MSTYRDCEDYVLDHVVKLEKENEELRAALLAESQENLALRTKLSVVAECTQVHECSSGTYLDMTIWDSSEYFHDVAEALNLPLPEEGGDHDE